MQASAPNPNAQRMTSPTSLTATVSSALPPGRRSTRCSACHLRLVAGGQFHGHLRGTLALHEAQGVVARILRRDGPNRADGPRLRRKPHDAVERERPPSSPRVVVADEIVASGSDDDPIGIDGPFGDLAARRTVFEANARATVRRFPRVFETLIDLRNPRALDEPGREHVQEDLALGRRALQELGQFALDRLPESPRQLGDQREERGTSAVEAAQSALVLFERDRPGRGVDRRDRETGALADLAELLQIALEAAPVALVQPRAVLETDASIPQKLEQQPNLPRDRLRRFARIARSPVSELLPALGHRHAVSPRASATPVCRSPAVCCGCMNDDELRLSDQFAAWLREQGHESKVEAQDARFATVAFRTRGRGYILRVDEQDRAFLYLSTEYRLADWVTDELQALRLAARTEAQVKGVKVGIDLARRACTFEVEQFLPEPGRLDGILWRTVTAADHGAETFWELARAEQPSSAQQFIDELEQGRPPRGNEMSMQLADALAEMLRTEGYRASVDGDGVSFKVEGQPFELQSFDADDGYARLVLGRVAGGRPHRACAARRERPQRGGEGRQDDALSRSRLRALHRRAALRRPPEAPARPRTLHQRGAWNR
jgi:hypothetical protein